MEGYRETEMCARCAGECCRRQPGHCLPRDFGSPQNVRAAVESGRYTIILLLDDNIMVRVVRPHYKDQEKRTGCTFLQERGCELELPDRPYGCRMLKPRDQEGGHCEPEGVSIEDAGLMWEESGYLPPIWKCVGPR
jgi:hypothetical protein